MDKDSEDNDDGVMITPNPQVYLFEDAYIRICSKSYDENKLDERERHLSNYTLQKEQFQNDSNKPNNEVKGNILNIKSIDKLQKKENKDVVYQNLDYVMSTSEFIKQINFLNQPN